jgi:hypothetical protein
MNREGRKGREEEKEIKKLPMFLFPSKSSRPLRPSR